MSDTLAILERLTSTPALSGREDALIKMIREAFTPLADDVQVDRLGNVVGQPAG